LTNRIGYPILIVKTYSTVQVAKLVGVSWSTLHRWIESQKIQAPALQSFGGLQIRVWTDDDLEAAKRYKAEHYWEKPGKKDRKSARSTQRK
jgi:excisionase family DNA binding protein